MSRPAWDAEAARSREAAASAERERLTRELRRQRFADPRLRRIQVSLIALGLVGVAVLVVATRDPVWLILIVAAALLGFGGPLIVASGRARGEANRRALLGWGAQHGLGFAPEAHEYRDVPVLRDGDRQEVGCGFSGPFYGLAGQLYEHVRVERQTTSDGNGNTSTKETRTSYAVLRVPLALPGVRRLAVEPRATRLGAHLLDRFESAVTRDQAFAFESTVFEDRYKVSADDGADAIAVTRLFPPTVLDYLAHGVPPAIRDGARAGKSPRIEYEDGVLVVAQQDQHVAIDRLAELELLVWWLRPVLDAFVRAGGGRVPDTPFAGPL